MTIHSRPAALMFAEMCSLSLEARCLLEEQAHCDDPARRQALMSRHAAVQQRWNELFRLHGAITLEESRANWQLGRR